MNRVSVVQDLNISIFILLLLKLNIKEFNFHKKNLFTLILMRLFS